MLTSVYESGAFSTIFLYLVDMKKSRIECEEFIEAEMRRNAFGDSEFVPATEIVA